MLELRPLAVLAAALAFQAGVAVAAGPAVTNGDGTTRVQLDSRMTNTPSSGFEERRDPPADLEKELLAPEATSEGRGPSMSEAEAADRAREQHGGGRVLSVRWTGEGYEVKLLRRGELRTVIVAD